MDRGIINFLQKHHATIARVAIFIVFAWFGFLKVIGASPANPLVADLLHKTLPFISFESFIILFGLFEIIIGVLFLIRGAERLAIALLVIHMITTLGPLIFLPSVTWQSAFVPTLEGQYIIKNLAIIALAISIASNLHPWKLDKKAKK
jgi:uncharacterized membrane protein YkgB